MFLIAVFFLLFAVLPAGAETQAWHSVQGSQYFTGNIDEIVPFRKHTNWKAVFPAAVSWPVPLSRNIILSGLDGKVRSLDASSGRTLWTTDCGAPVSHSTVHDGERVIVTAGRSILCLDGRTGAILWGQTDPANGIYVHPVIAGDRCLYGTRKKLLCRSILTGRLLWENSRPDLYGGSMTFYDDLLVLQTSESATRSVSVFRLSDGSPVWQREIPRQASIFTPVIYEDRVHVPSGQSVYCFNLRSGRTIWTRTLPAKINSETVFSSGRLFVSTEEGTIEILDPATGESTETLRFSRGRLFFSTVGEELLVLDSSAGLLYKNSLAGKREVFLDTALPGSGQRFIVHEGNLLLPLRNTLTSVGNGFPDSPPASPEEFLLAGFLSDPEGRPLTGTILLPSGKRIPVDGSFAIPLPAGTPEIAVFAPDYIVRTLPVDDPPRRMEITLEPAERESRFALRTILFDYNSSSLRPESVPVLESVREYLESSPNLKILLRGHTDNIGSAEFNRNLSLRRAERVREYLVKNGILESRLFLEGAGASEPAASNETEEGRALNRRIEFVIR